MPRGENKLIAHSPNTIYSRWYPGSLRGDLWVERLRIIDLKAFLMASFLGGSTVGGWEHIVAMREHAFIRQRKQVSSRQKSAQQECEEPPFTSQALTSLDLTWFGKALLLKFS